MPTLAQRMQSDADTLAFLEKAQTGQTRLSTATGYDAVIDQIRGVSPLAGAVNIFRDVYEG